jgi:Protein of unknown function (DUF3810)
MARSRLSHPVRGWLVLSLLAAAVALAPVPPRIVEEFYSHDFYPWLQWGLTAVSNQVPIAVLDILIVVAAVVAVVRGLQLAALARERGGLSALWQGLRRLIRAAAVLVLVFFLAWGCQYRRMPIETTLDPVPTPPTEQALMLAVGDANALGASVRQRLPAGESLSYQAAADALRDPMNAALAELHLAPLARPGRPKFSLLLTPYFTWAGINGMIDPLALESIVHPDLVPVERPFVLAHEWAHLAGEADEAEASAVGWLACMKGGPPLAYSASLYLIMEAGGALPPQARARAYAKLDAGIRRDMELIAARLQLEKPQVQRAAFRVYDQYLKANRVEDGTRSYGRALTLILSPTFRDALNTYRDRHPS